MSTPLNRAGRHVSGFSLGCCVLVCASCLLTPDARAVTVTWLDDVDGYADWSAAEAAGWQRWLDAGGVQWDVATPTVPPNTTGMAFVGPSESNVADKSLVAARLLLGATSVLTFSHTYVFEPLWDGGVIEISTDDGNSWNDLDPYITANGYTAQLYSSGNPLAGRWAWTGTTNSEWKTVSVNLSAAYAFTPVRIRWRLGSDSTQGSGNLWWVDDIQITDVVISPLPFHTAMYTALSGAPKVRLEWMNPGVGPYGHTKICRTSSPYPVNPDYFPDNPTCSAYVIQDAGLGAHDIYLDGVGLGYATVYYYCGFVADKDENTTYSDPKCVAAVAYDPAPLLGRVNWGFHTGATALAPPGIGSIFALSDDFGVYSMNDGGAWPGGFTPTKLGGPAQERPAVVTIPWPTPGSPTSKKVVYVTAQDGRVTATDGNTGSDTLLWTSADYGTLQGGPAGMFTSFGGSSDLILAGTRNSLADNSLVALNAYSGTLAWQFTNSVAQGGTGLGIGIISSMPAVEYTSRAYFTSRERAGGSTGTLWCVTFTAATANLCAGNWPRSLGDIDASPIVREGRVYVGTVGGSVVAVDATSGDTFWTRALGDGAVKGYVWADPTSLKLYVSTTNRVWGLVDNGGSSSVSWYRDDIYRPSVPLLVVGSTYLFVGQSSDGAVLHAGELYQLLTLDGTTPPEAHVMIGDGSSTVGSPTVDVSTDTLYVGTESGACYSVVYPLVAVR